VGILYGSCQAILTILGMSYVSANFFPWLLTQEQKENHLSVSSNMLDCAKTD
jgi:hypothetical protein